MTAKRGKNPKGKNKENYTVKCVKLLLNLANRSFSLWAPLRGLIAAHYGWALPWKLRVTVEAKGRQDTHSRCGGLVVHLVTRVRDFSSAISPGSQQTKDRHLGEETFL